LLPPEIEDYYIYGTVLLFPQGLQTAITNVITNVVIHVGLRKINTSIPQLACTLSNNYSSSLLCIDRSGRWSTSGGARPPPSSTPHSSVVDPIKFRRRAHKVPPVFRPPKSHSTCIICHLTMVIVFLHLSYTHQVPSISTKSRQSSALLHVPQGSNPHGSPRSYRVEPAVAESMRAMYSRKAPM
jgi:hypothetical protein